MAYLLGMQHSSFGSMHCPIARSLDRVGEWGSMLTRRRIPRVAERGARPVLRGGVA